MLLRLIFVLFAIAFMAFTWFYTGQAKSCQAVNDPKGTCKCKATWVWLNEGNKTTSEAEDSFQGCEDDCQAFSTEKFCNNDCPNGSTPEEKNALCPGRKDVYKNVQEHSCNCPISSTVN